MADLFSEKSVDWDVNTRVQNISTGIRQTLLQHVTLEPTLQVMDFGAGTGLICEAIAPHVKQIVAVDISSSMLEKLVQKPALQHNVQTVCQDILERPLTQQFDLIVSAMAMHHVDDTALLIKRLAQHLNESGKIALADLDQEDGTFHAQGTQGVFHAGFDRADLTTLLAHNGFGNIQFYTAHTVYKDDKAYPIFLLTAEKMG